MNIGTAFFIGLISGVLLLILIMLISLYLVANSEGYNSISEWLDD